MAEMYPRYLKPDEELRRAGMDPISAAERKLFEAFREALADDFVVFHGVRVHGRGRRGGVRDREIDFLIAHPEHGLLALEVKGGRIRVDGRDRQWTSIDGRDEVHKIRDPFEQVRQANYDLLAFLQNSAELQSHPFSLWYGVALPDVDVDGDLGPGAPRAITLDRRDILPANVAAAVDRVYDYYRETGLRPPGTRGIQALKRVLARDWFLLPYAATEFLEEEAQFVQLTEQQYQVPRFTGVIAGDGQSLAFAVLPVAVTGDFDDFVGRPVGLAVAGRLRRDPRDQQGRIGFGDALGERHRRLPADRTFIRTGEARGNSRQQQRTGGNQNERESMTRHGGSVL